MDGPFYRARPGGRAGGSRAGQDSRRPGRCPRRPDSARDGARSARSQAGWRGLCARWQLVVGACWWLPAFLGSLCWGWLNAVIGGLEMWLGTGDSGWGAGRLGQRAGGDAGQCDDRWVAFDWGQFHAGAGGGGEQQCVIGQVLQRGGLDRVFIHPLGGFGL